MMNYDNGDGVGVERYAPSDHGVLPIMAWQSQTANSCAAPALGDMDSFAWASVSRSTTLTGASPFPPAASAGYEHIPADTGRLEGAGPSGGSGWKKRRRSYEAPGTDQAKTASASADSAEDTERGKDVNGEETGPAAAAGKSKGRGAKEAGDPRKEGYVDVRARSGQATNSHSLAEKLRREKISERMKLLQDLVPGCNKVTGKAVMLDEIINYVQSLQRQVEFLAMKLSTVNPRLGVNVESLVAKVLRFPWSPLTPPMGLSFAQEMMSKPPQLGMLQGDVHGMANSDMFRTMMQSFSQEPPSHQVHHALSGSFDGPVQMVYPPLVLGSEDLSIRPDQNRFHM